jgi:hypothetical protein
MPSKTIDDRLKSCFEILSAGEAYLPLIRQGSDALMGEGAGDKLAGVLELALLSMTGWRDRVQEADRRLKLEREESVQATAERDRCATKCRAKLIPLRNSVTGLFGEHYARQLGFVGPTPEHPMSLYRLASEVIDKARNTAKPTANPDELTVDPVALTEPLIEPTENLRLALKSWAGELRESDLAQVEKDAATAGFDRAFSAAAKLLSTFLEIAGERELARQVRPPTRRSGKSRRAAGGDENPETEASSPDEPGSADAAHRRLATSRAPGELPACRSRLSRALLVA